MPWRFRAICSVCKVVSRSRALSFDNVFTPGATQTFTLAHPGRIRVKGLTELGDQVQIRVVPNELFAVTPGLGGFAIPNVPPGTYALRAVAEHAGWRSVLCEVTVEPGQPAQIDVRLERL